MKFQKSTFPSLVVLTLLVFSACNAGPEATPPTDEGELPTVDEIDSTSEEENEENGEINEEDNDEEVASDPIVEVEVEEVAMEGGELPEPEYKSYTPDNYDELLGKESFVLSFHANWCSVCEGIKEDVLANLSDFPKGTKILEANFDTETELKAKYGIAVQSTLVIVDKEGNHVETLAAPNNKEIINAISATL
jgi:thiol-disulfide isomerase/thioredoxin